MNERNHVVPCCLRIELSLNITLHDYIYIEIMKCSYISLSVFDSLFMQESNSCFFTVDSLVFHDKSKHTHDDGSKNIHISYNSLSRINQMSNILFFFRDLVGGC